MELETVWIKAVINSFLLERKSSKLHKNEFKMCLKPFGSKRIIDEENYFHPIFLLKYLKLFCTVW